MNEVEKSIDLLVQNGLKALDEYKNLSQEQVDKIVEAAAAAAAANSAALALHAVEETGRGVYEDKVTKNLFGSINVSNKLRGMKTVGIIDENLETGIVQVAAPLGVICGVTPTTNPTSTVFFKALIALKTRNPIIFGFHPAAQQCSAAAAKVILDAAVKAGAPKNAIQWIDKPSIEATAALMGHEGIASILATGGNAMVKAAYSYGKPALGVGAGNVPAYIEKSANIKQAVYDVVMSKSFDNGMICASEQAIIADKEIYDEVKAEIQKYGVYLCSPAEKAKLEEFVFGAQANSKNCGGAKLNAAVVGRPATWIAEQSGFQVPADTIVLLAEVSTVGEVEPLTREKLSPVLAMVKAKSTEDGIALAAKMVELNGLGHTAAIHTSNYEIEKQFVLEVKAIRVLSNQPSTFGAIGDIYNSLMPSMTLGCGSYGKNSVSDNTFANHLLNIKKLARRMEPKAEFKSKPDFSQGGFALVKEALEVKIDDQLSEEEISKLGLNILARATESYVSVGASKQSDEAALEAIKLAWSSVAAASKKDAKALANLQKANELSQVAAFNAGLGLNHGAAYEVAKKNSVKLSDAINVLFPLVVEYNGTIPHKVTINPGYSYYVADAKYYEVVKALGLSASSKEQAGKVYAQEIKLLASKLGLSLELEKFCKHSFPEVSNKIYVNPLTPANPRQAMLLEVTEEILAKVN